MHTSDHQIRCIIIMLLVKKLHTCDNSGAGTVGHSEAYTSAIQGLFCSSFCFCVLFYVLLVCLFPCSCLSYFFLQLAMKSSVFLSLQFFFLSLDIYRHLIAKSGFHQFFFSFLDF